MCVCVCVCVYTNIRILFIIIFLLFTLKPIFVLVINLFIAMSILQRKLLYNSAIKYT